jgi:hypothetical protein
MEVVGVVRDLRDASLEQARAASNDLGAVVQAGATCRAVPAFRGAGERSRVAASSALAPGNRRGGSADAASRRSWR